MWPSGHPAIRPVTYMAIRSSECHLHGHPVIHFRSSGHPNVTYMAIRPSECPRTKLGRLRRALPLYLIFRVSECLVQAVLREFGTSLFPANSDLFPQAVLENNRTRLPIRCIFEVFATEFIVSFVCRKTRSYTVSRGELNPVQEYFQYVYQLCATNRPFSNISSTFIRY